MPAGVIEGDLVDVRRSRVAPLLGSGLVAMVGVFGLWYGGFKGHAIAVGAVMLVPYLLAIALWPGLAVEVLDDRVVLGSYAARPPSWRRRSFPLAAVERVELRTEIEHGWLAGGGTSRVRHLRLHIRGADGSIELYDVSASRRDLRQLKGGFR